MTSNEFIWMTRQQYTRLRNTLNELRSRLIVEVPDDLMDFDAKRSALQRRISEIQNLLARAVIGENPASDSIAKPGMVLTIRYDFTGETETFLLGRRGSEGADITVYSMASPLGRAIAGARPGDQRIYSIPGEAGRLVTLLAAVPYEMHLTKGARSQAATQAPGQQRAPRKLTTPEMFASRGGRDLNRPPRKESNEQHQHGARFEFAARL